MVFAENIPSNIRNKARCLLSTLHYLIVLDILAVQYTKGKGGKGMRIIGSKRNKQKEEGNIIY